MRFRWRCHARLDTKTTLFPSDFPGPTGVHQTPQEPRCFNGHRPPLAGRLVVLTKKSASSSRDPRRLLRVRIALPHWSRCWPALTGAARRISVSSPALFKPRALKGATVMRFRWVYHACARSRYPERAIGCLLSDPERERGRQWCLVTACSPVVPSHCLPAGSHPAKYGASHARRIACSVFTPSSKGRHGYEVSVGIPRSCPLSLPRAGDRVLAL